MGRDKRVGINEDKNVVVSSSCASVADLPDMMVGLLDHGETTVSCDCRRSVGAGVVDTENLEGSISLGLQESLRRQEMIDCFVKVMLFVEGRDDH